MKLIWFIALTSYLTGCSNVALSPPVQNPRPSSGAEQKLLEQGEKYFKQGKVDLALQKSQAVLKLNPSNIEALYAVATVYLAQGDYNKSLEFSKRAASYKTEHLPDIYLLMGLTYERLDDPWNALRTYRFAASQYPKNPAIQYRLGQIYVVLNKPEFAADAFKVALRADPNNAAAHFQLGMLYYSHGYSTPAILSLSVALLLEPKRDPAPMIRKHIIEQLNGAASDSNKTDEGNFQSVNAALARQRTKLMKKSVKLSEFETVKAQYRTLFKELNKTTFKNQKNVFVLEYYVPFYNKLYQQGLSEAYVYYIFQGMQDKAINNWLKNNQGKTQRLKQWVKKYNW
jgi:cytochrome c-type biogenesis protein CcmH/NrfG